LETIKADEAAELRPFKSDGLCMNFATRALRPFWGTKQSQKFQNCFWKYDLSKILVLRSLDISMYPYRRMLWSKSNFY